MTAKGNTALRSWLALAVAVSLTAQAQQGKTDTLTSVSAGGWDTGFDPAYCYSAGCAWILNNTSEALFKHNAEDVSVIEPLLVAQMPSVANGGISKDGKTYTLKLRPGLKFSDGTPLTADDVAYSKSFQSKKMCCVGRSFPHRNGEKQGQYGKYHFDRAGDGARSRWRRGEWEG